MVDVHGIKLDLNELQNKTQSPLEFSSNIKLSVEGKVEDCEEHLSSDDKLVLCASSKYQMAPVSSGYRSSTLQAVNEPETPMEYSSLQKDNTGEISVDLKVENMLQEGSADDSENISKSSSVEDVNIFLFKQPSQTRSGESIMENSMRERDLKDPKLYLSDVSTGTNMLFASDDDFETGTS